MTPLISTKSFAAVALTLGLFAASSAAHAASDVYFSFGVQIPGGYAHSAPVYVQPRPVPLPAPVYYGRFDDGRHQNGYRWQHRGPYGDLDRDGLANRWDRDRDGDGVPNHHDRRPNNPYRR